MVELPTTFRRLLEEKKLANSQLSSGDRASLEPLFAGGILLKTKLGRGEVIVLEKEPEFRAWLASKFPSFAGGWKIRDDDLRAKAVAFRRDSKASGEGVVNGVLQLRGFTGRPLKVTYNEQEFPVSEMTERFGVASCILSDETRFEFTGQVVLVENLECFLRAEAIVRNAACGIHSSGRVSDRLIFCLKRSSFRPSPLLHLPDYDPVGLSDYLRLRAELGDEVKLWIPETLESKFRAFGNHALISSKPRNRELLVSLSATAWPCEESRRVFTLIKETGMGLEQESLLIHAT